MGSTLPAVFGSGSVLHLLCDFEERVQPAVVRDQSVPRHVVLHVQCHQPALYLVLGVDACNLLKPQAHFVQRLAGLAIARAIYYLPLLQRTLSCGTRSRVQLQCRTFTVHQAFTILEVANDIPRPPCEARNEQPTFMTG